MAVTLERTDSFVLTLSCPDVVGIVHAVSGFLAERGGNIVESSQYGDPLSGRFFMRVQFVPPHQATVPSLSAEFSGIAARFGMYWQLRSAARPTRTLIMVSKFGHCLHDLLFRAEVGSLNIEVAAVVSNHTDFAGLAAARGIPFHHIPLTPETKQTAEDQLLALVNDLNIDLVVLARYMQVLSDRVCTALAGRAINIHHSFLPSFHGARPYHQAHQRGVKLIGATAHYVTSVLDEGPIIEQDVARVGHWASPSQMAVLGRDVETQVLARAVGWHADHRVLLDGRRTIVFD